MLWHRQVIFESKGDELSSSAECRIRSREVSDTNSPADWMPTHKPTELSRIKLKTWTQQAVPMMSEHSAHLTLLPIGFRTWLWWYTCLMFVVVNFDALAQASDFRIEMGRVVFLCWIQHSKYIDWRCAGLIWRKYIIGYDIDYSQYARTRLLIGLISTKWTMALCRRESKAKLSVNHYEFEQLQYSWQTLISIGVIIYYQVEEGAINCKYSKIIPALNPWVW